MQHETGWMVDGYLTWIALWVWIAAVLMYGAWRSLSHPAPDSIRPSGPIDL